MRLSSLLQGRSASWNTIGPDTLIFRSGMMAARAQLLFGRAIVVEHRRYIETIRGRSRARERGAANPESVMRVQSRAKSGIAGRV